MIRKEELLKNINKHLGTLKNYTDLNNKIGYTDINKSSEDFYAGLLSIIYEIDLINMNEIKVNHPAIDLGDIESKICYQVTSTSERTKIQDTLDMFEKHKLHEKYNELFILIITVKETYKKDFKSHSINFDKNINILDIRDLVKEISTIKNIKKIERISDYLDDELSLHNSNNKEKELDKNILALLESEIRDNISKIMSQSITTGNIKFNFKDVLNSIDECEFRNFKLDNDGHYLFYYTLSTSQYDKFENQLINLNTTSAKTTIELYMQFKQWNKYKDNMFHMRVDEYGKFREVLLQKLNTCTVITKGIL